MNARLGLERAMKFLFVVDFDEHVELTSVGHIEEGQRALPARGRRR